MEKIIAEFKAKSHFVDGLGRGLFFPWDLYERAKGLGVVIDAHALVDSVRCKVEIVKFLYVCLTAYDQVAAQLGIKTAEPISIDHVAGWVAFRPDEAAGAMRYITDQLTAKISGGDSGKKKRLNKRELKKPCPLSVDYEAAEQFLLYVCQRDYFGTLLTTYREYKRLSEGYNEDREFWMWQVRDICFYAAALDMLKSSGIRQPSDMWPVTRKEFEQRQPTITINPNSRKERTHRRAMATELAKMGIKFV